MKFVEMEESNRIFVIRLEVGEDIIESLEAFIKVKNIKSGMITGIGALSRATIGYFDIKQKKYQRTSYDEFFELTSLFGNISWENKAPIIHCHFTLGRSDNSVMGGHLLSPNIVSITCEIYIFEGRKKISRIQDKNWNLNLLNL